MTPLPFGHGVCRLQQIHNAHCQTGERIQAFGLTHDGLLQFQFKTQEDRAKCKKYLGEELDGVGKSLNDPTESEIGSSTDDPRTYILTLSSQDTKRYIETP